MKYLLVFTLLVSHFPFSFAQQTIGTGITQGFLRSSDRMLNNGAHYHTYCYYPRLGQAMTVRMMSDDVDAYLQVISPSGRVRRDNDSGNGTDARLRYAEIEEGGGECWTIVATTFRGYQTGSYEIRVEDRVLPSAPEAAGAIGLGIAICLLGGCGE